ncbi:DedA family protein [Candidatus Gracilibacteria bacterium]|nr:MAG: DedA family protein [Candidatus Gracilibacteria bacterium]
MHAIIDPILEFFGTLGYLDIFILMTIESSVFPFPSEIVMIPAGVYAASGNINPFLATLAGGLGSIVGALFNYYVIGRWLGRPFLKKYGKYVFVPEETYQKAEKLFQKNALLYTFVARFITVIRQVISVPAGIFQMKIIPFIGATFLGATIWCGFLLALGYYFGESVMEMVRTDGHIVALIAIPLIALYVWWKIFKK